MNIIICGAGHVGSQSAEILATAGHNVTIIDQNELKLRAIEERLDLQTLLGNCATAETLEKAGGSRADLVVAATNLDEVNLLTASVASGVGAARTIARVHHSTYFSQRGLDYKRHLKIDHLICPEDATARAVARTLRNPAALALENFARGRLEMQEFPVSENAPAIGKPLSQVRLPPGTRLATVQHEGTIFIPRGDTVVHPGDIVILVGNADAFAGARNLFLEEKGGRRRIALMGGSPIAVYLARALRDRSFSLRIFEENIERASELAEKLDWVTVINDSALERRVFDEEHLENTDAFVALLDDDERNILGCAWAKSLGAKMVIAIAQQPDYLHLLSTIGIDRAFSPRTEAGREIVRFIDTKPIQRMSSLAEGVVDVYSIRVGKATELIGRPLRDVSVGSKQWIIAAIQHDDSISVPGADDMIEVGDTVLVIGKHGEDAQLKKAFGAV